MSDRRSKMDADDDAASTVTILASFVAVVLLFMFGVLDIGSSGNNDIDSNVPGVDALPPASGSHD